MGDIAQSKSTGLALILSMEDEKENSYFKDPFCSWLCSVLFIRNLIKIGWPCFLFYTLHYQLSMIEAYSWLLNLLDNELFPLLKNQLLISLESLDLILAEEITK